MTAIPRYTAGIRKVFDTTHTGASFTAANEKALAAGYQALVFNGVIWVYDSEGKMWIETVFKGSDFQF